jgi:glycine/D-amino acid oxidase-like deaminating enzyme
VNQITVVGGGIAGLVAATECAEAGAPVRLLEARGRLGGRGASSPGPYVAGLGPHAFYTGGSLWDWLVARDLQRPYQRPPFTGLRFRWQGKLHRALPSIVATGARVARGHVPVDESLREWVTRRGNTTMAEAIAGAAGVLTFDHDPGRLSAKFVVDRVRRILLSFPPPARYVTGGWSAAIDRMVAHAESVGVRIETGAKVDSLDDITGGPVILAVAPRAARQLLGNDSLRVEAPRVALLDIGVETRRGDPYIVLDLDEAAFVDRFTAVDQSLAPQGHELIQASIGMRPGETLEEAVKRIEAILDLAFGKWRQRETWRRHYSVTESTGAIDLPGATYQDRPAIDYDSDILLAGDWVAAPGHLAEVSSNSAQHAARLAVARLTTAAHTSPQRPARNLAAGPAS